MRKEDIIGYFVTAAFCFPFFLTSVSTCKDRLSCKDRINGTFIEILLDNSFGVTKTWAVFEYQYNGKKYHGYAIDRLSGRTQKKLIPGEVYPLYINPKKPGWFRCTKRIVMFQEVVLFLLGGFGFFGSILVLLQNLFSYFS